MGSRRPSKQGGRDMCSTEAPFIALLFTTVPTGTSIVTRFGAFLPTAKRNATVQVLGSCR